MIINLREAFLRQQNLIAFNFFNIENISAILEAAKKKNKIVILSFGESYISHTPLSVAACMAVEYSKIYDIPFVLHLDHARSIDTIKEAVKLGFSSVMYDGSKLSLEENMVNTAYVTEWAKNWNVSVEGELGYLNEEDGSNQVELVYTSVADSIKFARETKVDALAIAVGNAHGDYKKEPDINLARIREISLATKIPLVLHGSSGISADVLTEAFRCGVRKINVNTELAISGSQGAYDYIKAHGIKSRFENVLMASKASIKASAIKFLEI